VHAAHGGSERQSKAVYSQALGQEPTLGFDHVGISIFGKLGPQPVAGLGRGSVPQIIGHDDEIARDIEWLTWPEQLIGELWNQELGTRAPSTMQQEHGIRDLAGGIANG
jgi:hypothetical protein